MENATIDVRGLFLEGDCTCSTPLGRLSEGSVEFDIIVPIVPLSVLKPGKTPAISVVTTLLDVGRR